MNTFRNSVRLVGNLGMDPEIRALDNNRKMARVSIAINESYKNDKGEKITDTQWPGDVGDAGKTCRRLAKKGR
jgi:single-strand DNA-binding protein